MKSDIDTFTEIGGAKICAYLTLNLEQKRTGNTKHIIGGKEVSNFHGLAICQYENEEGFYLFYCDSNWMEKTDTWHEDMESAKKQASFEFEGLEGVWKKK